MRFFPRLVAAVVVAALPAWPLASADAGQQAHGPKKETTAARPETPAVKTDSQAPKAEAAKPSAAKPGAAKDAPSVEDVVKRINAILAEGPGPDTPRKAGVEPPVSVTSPKPRSAPRPAAVRTPPVRPVAPVARTAMAGVVLKWDPALTKRGVALVWDAELTGVPEPSHPGVKLLWPER